MASPPPRRRLPFILTALSLLVLAALVLLVINGGRDEEHELLMGDPVPESDAPLVVFAEFGQAADEIFIAPADNPLDRVQIATVEHTHGWGINPALEMTGSLAVYTVLPPDVRPQPDSLAELWLLDVASGKRTRLARDADLLATPTLARDGGTIVYRSTPAAGVQDLVRIDIASRTRRVIHTVYTDFGVFPVAITPDGELLFSQISLTGTNLHAISLEGSVAGKARELLHASSQIARDWRLSPDGTTLSYLAPESVAERIVHRLHVVTLDRLGAREQQPPSTDEASTAEQYGPVWTPDGTALTVGREASAAQTAAAITLPLNKSSMPTTLAAPEMGFDVPLGWSPDGETLATRTFDGHNSADPGNEQLTLIGSGGVRRIITSRSEVIFLGWWDRD